jgi:hypothetical protein
MKVNADLARQIIGDDADGWKVLEDGPWISKGKYETCSYIVEHEGKFYTVTDSRSGSPFSYYKYESREWEEDVEFVEVERREKVVKYWAEV